jgi:hypothetical protein
MELTINILSKILFVVLVVFGVIALWNIQTAVYMSPKEFFNNSFVFLVGFKTFIDAFKNEKKGM